MGTITQKSEQPKRRKELQARMHIHTSQLVNAILEMLTTSQEDEGETDKDVLLRAWQTWCFVTSRPYERDYPEEIPQTEWRKEFGARSFGMIVLAAIFKIMDRLDSRPVGTEAEATTLAMGEDFEVAVE